MSDASSAERWARWRSACTATFTDPLSDIERAARIATELLALFPEAAHVACRLVGGASSALARDGEGGRAPEAPGLLSSAGGAVTPVRFGVGDGLAAAFAEGAGLLAVAPPPDPSALARAAGSLELGAALTDVSTARRKIEGEFADMATFATLGVAADGIAHEFNNVLNTMMLQASVVKMQVAEKLKEPVEVIRKQGNQAAALLRPMQQFRQLRRRSMTPSDLNAVVTELLAEHPEWATITTDLSPGLAPVPLSRYEWGRLFRHLVSCAVGRSGTGPTRIKTGPGPDGRIRLTLTDSGGVPTPTALVQPFAPGESGVLAGHGDEFELLAVQSILRQHFASLEAEATSSGATVHVDFRTS